MITSVVRKFIAHAEKIEPGPMIDPQSRWIHALLFGWLALFLIAFFRSDFFIGDKLAVKTFLFAAWIMLNGCLLRRYGHGKIARFLEGISIVVMAVLLSLGSVPLLASWSGPFADNALVKLDAMFGFDWRDAARFYASHPGFVALSEASYNSFAIQMLVIPPFLFLWRGGERAWNYLLAYLLTTLLTLAVFPFFPPVGPYIHFGVARDAIPGIGNTFPHGWQWKFGGWISEFQQGQNRDLAKAFSGLVSIPSYHAAMGVLFIWNCKGVRFLWWPLVALNMTMIGSALVSGSHYLIDLIAGVGVAAIGICAAKSILDRAPSRPPP